MYKTMETHLTDFTLVTRDEVLKLIKQSSAKSYSLDPLPTSLVKECASTLAPAVANLVNLSLQLGELPLELKQKAVIPMMKKPTLDKNVLKHYRPVFNIHCVSKLSCQTAVKTPLGQWPLRAIPVGVQNRAQYEDRSHSR